MRSVLSAFLVALALFVNLALATPAAAGLVSTPALPREERQSALDRGARGAPGAAESLKVLPTADLLLLASLPGSQIRAANDALVALLVIAGVILFIGLIITIVIIDRVRRHRRHLGMEAGPGPRRVAEVP